MPSTSTHSESKRSKKAARTTSRCSTSTKVDPRPSRQSRAISEASTTEAHATTHLRSLDDRSTCDATNVRPLTNRGTTRTTAHNHLHDTAQRGLSQAQTTSLAPAIQNIRRDCIHHISRTGPQLLGESIHLDKRKHEAENKGHQKPPTTISEALHIHRAHIHTDNAAGPSTHPSTQARAQNCDESRQRPGRESRAPPRASESLDDDAVYEDDENAQTQPKAQPEQRQRRRARAQAASTTTPATDQHPSPKQNSEDSTQPHHRLHPTPAAARPDSSTTKTLLRHRRARTSATERRRRRRRSRGPRRTPPRPGRHGKQRLSSTATQTKLNKLTGTPSPRQRHRTTPNHTGKNRQTLHVQENDFRTKLHRSSRTTPSKPRSRATKLRPKAIQSS